MLRFTKEKAGRGRKGVCISQHSKVVNKYKVLIITNTAHWSAYSAGFLVSACSLHATLPQSHNISYTPRGSSTTKVVPIVA